MLRADESPEVALGGHLSLATREARQPAQIGSKAGQEQLLGRGTALADLSQLLAAEKLITLTGTGGVGKTSLAISVSERVQGHYHDGVLLCALSTVSRSDSVLPALLTALQVPTSSADDPR